MIRPETPETLRRIRATFGDHFDAVAGRDVFPIVHACTVVTTEDGSYSVECLSCGPIALHEILTAAQVRATVHTQHKGADAYAVAGPWGAQ